MVSRAFAAGSRRFRRACLPLLSLGLAACASAPPPGPPPTIGSFGDFRPSARVAHYLACPQGYCLEANEFTRLIDIPADRMRFIVKDALDAMPRMTLLSSDHEGLRLVYRQDGSFWGSSANFATVEVVDADTGVSGIAIYSQPVGSSRDWHPNRDQVDAMLAAIEAAAARQGGGKAPNS